MVGEYGPWFRISQPLLETLFDCLTIHFLPKFESKTKKANGSVNQKGCYFQILKIGLAIQ